MAPLVSLLSMEAEGVARLVGVVPRDGVRDHGDGGSDEPAPLLVGGLGREPDPLVWLVGVAGGRQPVVAHHAVDGDAPLVHPGGHHLRQLLLRDVLGHAGDGHVAQQRPHVHLLHFQRRLAEDVAHGGHAGLA